jgi:putative hydrolase of the HAD superfamily
VRGFLIFDGDDTLWVTEPLYDQARLRAAEVVSAAGLDAGAWDELERSIDVANVARFGLNADRFPTSCVEALDALAREQGREIRDSTRKDVWDAATSVFKNVAPVVDGANDVLSALHEKFGLALLTKGDAAVQRKRIADSGLAHYFDAVSIVAAKDANAFRVLPPPEIRDPRFVWSIGNSLSSDVLPALEAEMQAILIETHVWEFERHTSAVPDGVWIARRLTDVPEIIEHALTATGTNSDF